MNNKSSLAYLWIVMKSGLFNNYFGGSKYCASVKLQSKE